MTKCPDCQGTGKQVKTVEISDTQEIGLRVLEEMTCTECEGTGFIEKYTPMDDDDWHLEGDGF